MFLDEQPQIYLDPVEFTHYDCWLVPDGQDYTLEYLEHALEHDTDAVADECEAVFGSWSRTLSLDVPPGHYAALFKQSGGWAGIEACELDAITRASDAGYRVFKGEAFCEVYPRPDSYLLSVATGALWDIWDACESMQLDIGALDSVADAIETATGTRPDGAWRGCPDN
jgi:hypothetical protein